MSCNSSVVRLVLIVVLGSVCRAAQASAPLEQLVSHSYASVKNSRNSKKSLAKSNDEVSHEALITWQNEMMNALQIGDIVTAELKAKLIKKALPNIQGLYSPFFCWG